MIRWQDKYALGVVEIDEQHRKLFEIAGEIEALLNDEFITDKYDDIVAILGELKDYTIQHFKDEEEFMLSNKFPMFLTHKMMHNDFVEKIESIDLSKVDNEQNLYLKEILNFVGEWLVEHILVEDAKYSIN
ncbi:MAG: hemerythrin family protein [Negativicutes bacterium]|nr:hemerythrin family protein [Negativicutes bacterium]